MTAKITTIDGNVRNMSIDHFSKKQVNYVHLLMKYLIN